MALPAGSAATEPDPGRGAREGRGGISGPVARQHAGAEVSRGPTTARVPSSSRVDWSGEPVRPPDPANEAEHRRLEVA
jgi:hypothetical protein